MLNYSVWCTYPVLILPVCWGGECWTAVASGLHDVSSCDVGLGVYRFKVVEFVFTDLFVLLLKKVCKMIPNSSFCFLRCTVLVVYVLVCISIFILYCTECAMRRLRLGYLCCCILCIRDVVFLLTFQFGQHMNYYTFCISVYIWG